MVIAALILVPGLLRILEQMLSAVATALLFLQILKTTTGNGAVGSVVDW